MAITLVGTAIFMSLFFVIYLIYEFIVVPYMKKGEGKLTRVFLYENISGKPVYLGNKVAEEKNDDVIGAYLLIRKLKIPLKRISNSDFIQDKQYGKCLHVVKFAEDDYRPLVRLTNQEWYREEKEYLYKDKITVDEETGEETTENIPILDKNGNHKYEIKTIKYNEPMGINQKDRDILSFNLMYKKRAEEKFRIKETTIAKYLPYISVAVMGMILLMGFIYMSKNTNETLLQITSKWDDNAKKIWDDQNNNGFIDNIAKKIRDKEDAEQSPPT